MTAINKSPNVFSSTIQHIWHPSVDGSLISRNPYESVRNGQIAKVCPKILYFRFIPRNYCRKYEAEGIF
jgi:hypothetical protein